MTCILFGKKHLNEVSYRKILAPQYPGVSKLLLTNSRNRSSTLELLLAAFLIKIITRYTISLFFPINSSDSASCSSPSPPFASHTLHLKFSNSLFRPGQIDIKHFRPVGFQEEAKTEKLLSRMTGSLHILSSC